MFSDRDDAKSVTEEVPDSSFIRRCAEDAICAIVNLWHEEGQTFWRSTTQRKRESSSRKFFPTVSFRCVDALLLTMQEQPDWLSREVRSQLKVTWAPAVVRRDLSKLESSLDRRTVKHELNVFTLSLYIQVLSRVVKTYSTDPAETRAAETKLADAVRHLLTHPALTQSDYAAALTARPLRGRLVKAVRQAFVPAADAEDIARPRTPHPFILYHACRALYLARNAISLRSAEANAAEIIEILIASTRHAVEQLTAKLSLGTLSPGDAIALAFCAATLSLIGTVEDLPFVLASIRTCFAYQDANGCWPLGRVVEEDKDLTSDRIEIATHHVAEVLADALARCIELRQCRADTEPVRTFADRLVRAGKYTDRSTVRLFSKALPRVGWCSDHAYGNEMIESWNSASVLSSLVSLERLVHAQQRELILAGFTTAMPSDPDWPAWQRWATYRIDSEVDHDHPILSYLQRQMVERINSDPRRLPPTNPRSVSALLFGPPGTSKTTIVKALADGLGWPLVLLSPGTFIEHGLEYIESQARQVFDRLMKLSKVVVLFDECDELFRERKPSVQNEQMRGITAFVTASMLPKLQDLHDRGQVVFFICTNNFQSIDSAVKRGGRIDHIIGVGPPDLIARRAIIGATYTEWKPDPNSDVLYADRALEELASSTTRFTRPELQRATRTLLQSAPWSAVDEAEHRARDVAQHVNPSLTITEHEYEQFQTLRDKYSQPVTETNA